MLADRKGHTYKQSKENGFLTICGHNPTEDAKILRNDSEGFIRIDTGLSYTGGQCSLYCIEDDNVEYIERKVNDLENENMK